MADVQLRFHQVRLARDTDLIRFLMDQLKRFGGTKNVNTFGTTFSFGFTSFTLRKSRDDHRKELDP